MTLVLATRIHLGQQSQIPPQSKLNDIVNNFHGLAKSCNASCAAIAVDCQELVDTIQHAIDNISKNKDEMKDDDDNNIVTIDVILVSPWGNFIPALNALVVWAGNVKDTKKNTTDKDEECISTESISNVDHLMMVSAEMNVSGEAIQSLCQHVDLHDTLVAGAALPGHDYQFNNSPTNSTSSDIGSEDRIVELNGRTTPWNTCAVWNLSKLALYGFPMVAEGLHRNADGSQLAGGVEEVSAILLHQRLDESTSKAKLVKVVGIEWEQDFNQDEERQKWHERKMKSKVERPAKQCDLLGIGKGCVIHC